MELFPFDDQLVPDLGADGGDDHLGLFLIHIVQDPVLLHAELELGQIVRSQLLHSFRDFGGLILQMSGDAGLDDLLLPGS
jgi:hypothetical protein